MSSVKQLIIKMEDLWEDDIIIRTPEDHDSYRAETAIAEVIFDDSEGNEIRMMLNREQAAEFALALIKLLHIDGADVDFLLQNIP